MNDLYTITRGNGGVIAWTDEQVAYIIDKYLNENYTLKQLGKEFSCNYGTIRNLLNKHHIQSRGNKQGYPRNEYYFSKIDTEEKAYWLGFLYADGCVHSNNNEISINITDKEHIEKFKIAIGAVNHKITETNDKRFPNAKTLYQFTIKDEQLHKDLIQWGCVPQKSLLLNKIPNIPRDFISHFIRGYFDGDGSIALTKDNRNNNLMYRINIVGTKNFVENLLKEIGFGYITKEKRCKEIYYYNCGAKRDFEKLYNFLYKDATLYMERKKEKFDIFKTNMSKDRV